MFTERDHYWMRRAIELAQHAEEQGEVPVGAVLVLNDEIIGEGYNQPISHCDATAHAEIVAIRDGAERISNYRIVHSTLYVTLEPCMMCLGAIVHARVQRVVFGASDPKSGAVSLADSKLFNHHAQFQGGLFAEECGLILSNFFKAKRQSKIIDINELSIP